MDMTNGPENQVLALAASLALVVSLLSTTAPAAEQEPSVLNPDPSIRAATARKTKEIHTSVENALNPDLAVDKRIKAIGMLSGLPFDFLLANAETLIKDSNADVGVATLTAIAARVPGLDAYTDDAYEQAVVKEAVRLLRVGLDNANDAVRNRAAATLASRGDVTALAKIQTYINTGKMPASQGIGYLSLAPQQVASPYLQEYASSGSVDVRAAAVAQLSYNASYTDRIRQIVLEKSTPEKVVSAALPGLAKSDNQFLNYGPLLAQDSSRSPNLRTEVIEQVARSAKGRDTVVRVAPILEGAARNVGGERASRAVVDLKESYDLK
jgi:hypothetical protein